MMVGGAAIQREKRTNAAGCCTRLFEGVSHV